LLLNIRSVLLDDLLDIALIVYLALCAGCVMKAFVSHKSTDTLVKAQIKQEDAVTASIMKLEEAVQNCPQSESRPEGASQGKNKKAVSCTDRDKKVQTEKHAIEAQLDVYRDAKYELDQARTQLLSSDTVAFLISLFSFFLAGFGITVFSRSHKQLKKLQHISSKIVPFINANTLHQSICISLGIAVNSARLLYAECINNKPNPFRDHLPSIRTCLEQVGKSARDPIVQEIGMTGVIYDRLCDLFGEVDRPLGRAIMWLRGNGKNSEDLEEVKDMLDRVRQDLCDPIYVTRWAGLVKEMKRVC
jgi:hypothetical protein